ncbi:MAG: hypothetical protein Q9219_004327 [cf. Caloplaca sp. 3 TL-2023]
MAEVPKTPTASAKGHAHKRARTELEAGDDSGIHISASQAEASSINVKETQTNNTRNLRKALASHLIFLNVPSARDRCKGFIDDVFEILTGDRSSVTSQRTIANIKKAQDENATAMENTYASNVFPLLMGKSRTVPDPELVADMQPLIRDFADDRLHCEGPCYFVKDLLKGPHTTKKEFGLSDPQPDLGFGIKRKEMDLNPPKLTPGTQNLIQVAGSIEHCFALEEVKGPDEPFAHAQTQALRGGATVVRANRELRARAGYKPSELGADPKTWVFTIAWMHGYAEIFVCWHEILAEGEADHMHLLEAYALHRADDIKRFQRDLHNVMDWGLDPERVAGLEKMVRDMADKEAAEGKV